MARDPLGLLMRDWRMKIAATALFVSIPFFCYSIVSASALSYVSDLITSSVPGADSDHEIKFTATHAIPVSGRITITPQNAAFTIPAGFDKTDVDIAVSTGGGAYIERAVASSVDVTNDGVLVTTGALGSITIVLNSSTGIGATDKVRIRLGKNAVFADTPTISLTNPTIPGSYRIAIATFDQSQTPIDSAATMIAVILPVTTLASTNQFPPILSNGLPTGTLQAGSSAIELSFDTNILSTCRYATSTGVAYASMTGRFSPAVDTSFYTTAFGHLNNTAYNYYVRCTAQQGGAVTTSDYVISFTLKPTPDTNTSIQESGSSLGHGGAGAFPNGSSVFYLATVQFSGWAEPQSTVTFLKDGVAAGSAVARADGTFTFSIAGLERGTYTFQVYSTDSRSRDSSSFTSTMTLGSGTTNEVAGIMISPTIELSKSTIAAADSVRISGESAPSTRIVVTAQEKSAAGVLGATHTFAATSTPGGMWELLTDKNALTKGTYSITARAVQSDQAQSDISKVLSLGVGQQAGPDLGKKSDVNGDGKVNLVDFSILLSFFGTKEPSVDFNGDGIVNLADFSILLFNWTG